MTNLVLNINVPGSGKERIFEDSTERARMYAERYGADFYSVTDCSRFPGYNPSWQRFIVFSEEFKKYDKILYVDGDLIITTLAPNIFELMDKHKQDFAASADYEHIKARKDSGYFNNGLVCMGRPWLDLWDSQYISDIMLEYKSITCWDQCCYNKMLRDSRESYLQLGRRWNTMNSDTSRIIGQVYGIHYIHYHKHRYSRNNLVEMEKLWASQEIIRDEKVFPFPEWYKAFDYKGILDMEQKYA